MSDYRIEIHDGQEYIYFRAGDEPYPTHRIELTPEMKQIVYLLLIGIGILPTHSHAAESRNSID